jgi:hypothetical protein
LTLFPYTTLFRSWKTAQKNIKVYAEKTIKYLRAMATNAKIRTKILTAFSKRFGKAAAARLGAFLTAQAAALMAAPVTGGLSLLASALILAVGAYDVYRLYDLLFVSSDGENEDGGLAASLNAEIEKEEKDTSPKPVAPDTAASSMSGSSTPAPALAVVTTPTPASAVTEYSTNWSTDAMGVPAGVALEKREVSGLGYGGKRKKTVAAVIHHTGGRSLDVAVQTLQSRKLAYHYLVDRDGKVVQILPDDLVAWHAGDTRKKKPGINNSNTVSISMVAADDKDVTPEQIAAATSLESMLAKKYGFNPKEAFGHGEVSPSKSPTEGLTIASAIRSGTTNQAIEKSIELNIPKTPEIVPDTTKAKAGDILTTASNEFNSGLRILEDLFVTGRPSFTNMSTTINQSNTISRPGGNLRTKEDASIQLLIQRQTM